LSEPQKIKQITKNTVQTKKRLPRLRLAMI